MGGKGGSPDNSGMVMAAASAQAAQLAYSLGTQQLDWAKQQFAAEQPLVNASEQQQMALAAAAQASMQQSTAESNQQYQQYQSLYAPLEAKFVDQAQNWASPENVALQRGQAMGSIAEQGQAGMNTAAETLRGYGINPSSPRYASLYTSAQPMLGAAEAAAGTGAEQNLKLQQLGLEGSAINTGRGLVNAAQGLTNAGTQAAGTGASAAAGAGTTAQSNLSTGSTAMTAPSQWFNSGAQNMGVYVDAVNGFNNSQAAFNQASAGGAAGIGSAIGGIAGMFKIDAGGPVPQGYADGGVTTTPTQGGGATGIPPAPIAPASSAPIPFGATTGGTVPTHASPSMGVTSDDVPAMLTANEFVIPKDVATWLGHKTLAGQIDKARAEQHKFSQRGDIGGEPTNAIPQSPTFVSRPQHSAGIPGAA